MPIRIPADWEGHDCCWMAWAVHSEWGDWRKAVKDELCTVIHTISQYEPVCLLVPREGLAEARGRFSGGNIEIIEAPVDDIWMRDIAPTFALYNSEVVAIDWNFNGWAEPMIDRHARGIISPEQRNRFLTYREYPSRLLPKEAPLSPMAKAH